jgi:MFS family permease
VAANATGASRREARVYQIESSSQILQLARKLLHRRPARLQVSANVVLLGLTSLFTDISSEMVTTVLPLYVLVNLNLSPMAFGLVDGLALGGAAVVRLAGGFVADRTRRYKSVAVAGYTLSMLSRATLLAFGSAWGWLLGVVLIDRLGKGIRSDARDAMISFSTPLSGLATAFGVHRALDTAGAMIGPLIAFGVLMAAPGAYDAVFVVSLCAALIGLAILVLFVENRPVAAVLPPRTDITIAAVARLVRLPDVRALVVAGGVLNLATMSDAFLYLTLQRRLEFQLSFFPLLYVATAAIYMVLALPAGLLADRIGRARVFTGGYLLLLLAYSALFLPSAGGAEVVVCLVLLGGYYAGTEGVLMAMASARLPDDLRSSGMALVMTVSNLSRLAASILFGWLWTWRGVEFAVAAFGSGLIAAILLTSFLLGWRREGPSDERLAAS